MPVVLNIFGFNSLFHLLCNLFCCLVIHSPRIYTGPRSEIPRYENTHDFLGGTGQEKNISVCFVVSSLVVMVILSGFAVTLRQTDRQKTDIKTDRQEGR